MTDPAVVNRKTVRKFLAAQLQVHLGSLVQAVYDYQKSSFGKQSPVVCVVSRESTRITTSLEMITTESQLAYDIHIFVRYQDSTAVPPYTEEQSEDLIDDIEAAIANFILAHGENSEGEKRIGADAIPWLGLAIESPSQIDQALIDNIDYRHETIAVAADVFNTQ